MLLAIWLVIAPAFACDVSVDQTGFLYGSVPTIQAALDRAQPGETICLLGGMPYSAGVTVDKDVTIRTMNYLGVTQTIQGGPDPSEPLFRITADQVVFEDVILDGTNTHAGIVIEETNVETVLTNVQFINGRARGGGGLFVSGGASAALTGCTFSDHVSDGDGSEVTDGGAAVYAADGAVLSIEDCAFANNVDEGANGGAIFLQGSTTTTVANSRFDGNQALGGGGHIYADGRSALTITDSVFENGLALEKGGALAATASADLIIERCTFQGNSSPQAPAVFHDDAFAASTVVVRRSLFCENAGNEFGAVSLVGQASLRNEWVGNVFAEMGDNAFALFRTAEDTLVINNTFFGSGVFSTVEATWINNVFVAHSSDIAVHSVGVPSRFSYNAFWQNPLGDANFVFEDSNLQVDPLLFGYGPGSCDVAGLVPVWNSPLLDAGDFAYLDEDGSRSDIGAFGGEAPMGRPFIPDVDGDGVDAAADCDDDNVDVFPGAVETCDGVDEDCTGISDDGPDADGDSVADICDVCPGGDDTVDTDSDTVPDACDSCPGSDDLADQDGDGVADGCDLCPADPLDDSDGDGVCDSEDLCPGFDDQVDSDGDGVADGCDLCPDDALDDSDGDGACDSDDLCAGFDDFADEDGDGVADGCDPCPLDNPDDSDGDGSCDSVDLCPGSDDGEDRDLDGVPDGCDACPDDDMDDGDGDGVCDSADVCPGFDDAVDADADGVPDGCDVCNGFPDSQDSDGDTIPNGCDGCEGDDRVDSDGDATADDCDLCPGYDDANDGDSDGVPDACDVCPGSPDLADADGDGVPDACDVCAGSPDEDTDGDGLPDACTPTLPEEEELPPAFFCGCQTGSTHPSHLLVWAGVVILFRRRP